MKFKPLKIIAMSMALMLAMPINAFATPINLDNSTESVATDILDKANGTDYFIDEITNVWQDGSITEEARVTVSRTSNFEITIPKEVILDGSTGTAAYKVKAKGDIAGDQKITVTPDTNFALNEAGGKANVTATVTQPNTEYNYTDLQGEGTEYNGNISATLSAGEWSGKFSFNIEFKASSTPTLPAKAAFNDMSWTDIATVSEAGKAPEYFSVGDEKKLQIGSETYRVQILGFDHDDKSDGTGKAGITVGLKEIMTTRKIMNSSRGNVGGWKDSEIRTYVNNNVYSSLPSDLQAVIKTVNKVSDNGYEDHTTLNTTQDKLFLFSFEEVGFTTSDDDGQNIVYGQGTKYEYFSDSNSRIKYLSDSASYWWLRSTDTDNIDYFCSVYYYGNAGINGAHIGGGVVFGFSI